MTKSFTAQLLALLILLLIGLGCSQTQGSRPLTPQQALKSFQIHEDFRIELYAAEPDVMDPVELVFDEAGRAFTACKIFQITVSPRFGSFRSRNLSIGVRCEPRCGSSAIKRQIRDALNMLAATSRARPVGRFIAGINFQSHFVATCLRAM